MIAHGDKNIRNLKTNSYKVQIHSVTLMLVINKMVTFCSVNIGQFCSLFFHSEICVTCYFICIILWPPATIIIKIAFIFLKIIIVTMNIIMGAIIIISTIILIAVVIIIINVSE